MVAQIHVKHVARLKRIIHRVNCSDVPVEQTVAVQVGDRVSHAVVIQPGSRRHRRFAEGAVAIVNEIVAGMKVADIEQLGPPIAVHVDETRRKAVALSGGEIVGKSRGRDIRERPIAFVPKQAIPDPAVDVSRHEQVQITVEVVVPKGRSPAVSDLGR